MHLHGLPASSVGKGIGCLPLKGLFAIKDMLAELSETQDDEATLCDVLASWYKITHVIDEFWRDQEPITGTYNCRFCGLDLVQVHHAHEHCFNCAKQDAIARAAALRNELFPLNRPSEYQFCSHGDQFQEFVSCGKTFATIKEQGDHRRSHVRTMKKKGPDGEFVLTCFFDTCAANPEGGRLDRDGPDFESPDDLLAHVWSTHQVVTLKSIDIHFCEYCSTWLPEPYECRSYADRHFDEAMEIVTQFEYTSVSAGAI